MSEVEYTHIWPLSRRLFGFESLDEGAACYTLGYDMRINMRCSMMVSNKAYRNLR